MLDRDKYEIDNCANYFPSNTMEEYVSYMAGPFSFRRLFSHSSDFIRQSEIRNNAVVAVFLTCTLPVIFHKKIYWFRSFTSRKSRVLMGLCWLIIPSNMLGAYFQFESNRELTLKYELNKDVFQKMLEVGDINVSNPYQEWVDF